MKQKENTNGYLTLDGAPGIAGLRFRPYHGEEDLPAMLAVIHGSRVEDRDDWVETLDNLTLQYRHLINCDPYRDLLLVELEGKIAGYSRVFWVDEAEGNRLLIHMAKLLPEQRGRGIRQAMLRWNEARLAEVRDECGRQRPHQGPVLYQASASDAEPHWASLLEGAGYRVVRYGFEMVRPDLEAIPDLPLPEGLDVRPVTPEQLPAIWEAAREAFRDHWGYCEDEFGDEQYRSFAEWAAPFIDTFQVAWSGDEVAGMVQCFIDPDQNETYGRRRGWTEGICVRRPWRRQGLAKALIARSLRVCRERGMDHAGLGVDAENPNGAVQLYRSMGFEVVKTHSTYRKEAQ
jgi:ribosomal protein S18 acetylase RimI-like enzyme